MGASTVSTSIKHIVIVALSHEAQKLAARKGKPAAVIQSWELPQDQVGRAIDMGAAVENTGSVVLAHRVRKVEDRERGEGAWHNGHPWREEYGNGPTALPRRPATAEEALDMIEAEREKAAAETDAEARKALVEAVKLKLGDTYWLKQSVERARKGRLTPEEVAKLDARVAAEEAHEAAQSAADRAERDLKEGEAVEAVRQRLEAAVSGKPYCGKLKLTLDHDSERRAKASFPDLLDRARKAEVERAAAKDAADQVALIARLNRLAALVREVSTDPLVIGRLDAPEGGGVMLGLLPEDEAVELVRDAKLPVPAGTVDYDSAKLTSKDASAECEDESGECEVSFGSAEPDDLTAEEWREVVTIRAALKASGLPEGELRLHTGTCECGSAPPDAARRVGVLVRLDLDGVAMKREYAAS